MADIKQAAKWMRMGKRVRRPRLSPEISLASCHGKREFTWIRVFVGENPRPGEYGEAPFTPEDLLADDWEIAE